jgi:hypothetical protein
MHDMPDKNKHDIEKSRERSHREIKEAADK